MSIKLIVSGISGVMIEDEGGRLNETTLGEKEVSACIHTIRRIHRLCQGTDRSPKIHCVAIFKNFLQCDLHSAVKLYKLLSPLTDLED